MLEAIPSEPAQRRMSRPSGEADEARGLEFIVSEMAGAGAVGTPGVFSRRRGAEPKATDIVSRIWCFGVRGKK